MKSHCGCTKSTKVKAVVCLLLVYLVIHIYDARLNSNIASREIQIESINDLEVFQDSHSPFTVVGNVTSKVNGVRRHSTCDYQLKPSDNSLRISSVSWADIEEANIVVSSGGKYSPTDCVAAYKIAIIIPLRDREDQLKTLLSHMHPVWQRQMLDYQVYVISQAGTGLFNRAKLLNIGVSEASKDAPYDCYVFHDVDLILEDEDCLYTCELNNPRHISHHIDLFSYKPISYYAPCNPSLESATVFSLIFPKLYGDEETQGFGGVSMMTGEQFASVNGFSNLYWGWGGEDDDMYHRIRKQAYSVVNPYGTKCSFRMIRHQHETGNAKNPTRFSLLRHAKARMHKEGFNSLRYRTLSKEFKSLYTNITVDIGQPSPTMMNFLTQRFLPVGIFACHAKMPWQAKKGR